MFSNVVKSECLWVRMDEINNLSFMKEKFTIDPKFDNLSPVPTYVINNGAFGFPRNAVVKARNFIDKTSDGRNVSVRFIGQLRRRQVPVIADFDKAMSDGINDLIIEAGSGSGKTVLMLKTWTTLKRTALVIVPKVDLIDQWIEKILEFTDLTVDRIGIARQGLCEYNGKDIVIGMIHSLCKDKYPDSFKKYFGIVYFDELHKLGAYHFSRVGGMFPAKYRIGATATLGRPDGLAPVFFLHIGSNIIKLHKSEQPVPKIAIYSYLEYSGRIPNYLTDNISRRGVLISRLASNEHRTNLIAYLSNQLIESGRQTLIVSERTNHLKELKKILVKAHGYPEDKIGVYIGSTSPKERARISSECICILATTSMINIGTDIPTLRALVFATPLSNVTQPLGRIRRLCELAPDTPIVLDIVDFRYKEAEGWYRGRLRSYDSIGCTLTHISG